jgi:prephenate dehydrogenase
MTNKKLKIAIIGYGRFGKLLTKILQPFGEIFILHYKKLENLNIKQIKYSDLKDIDWVIPCVPISVLEKILQKINPYLKKNSLVMDVCSVKVYPSQWLEKYISKEINILASHPMFGPDSAKQGLKNLQIVFCPLRISQEKLNLITNIFQELKLKIITTTPENHDQQVAKSLALVHFIGRGLGEMNIGNQKITTLGFERLLKVNETVNNDTLELFFDMHRFNPYTEKIRQEFIDSLKKLNKLIKS